MKNLDEITEQLYLQPEIGLSDVKSRAELNRRLGTFDFEAEIAHALRLQPGEALLDVGCGTGRHLTKFREEHGIQPYGLDPALPEDRTGLHFVRGSAENLPFPAEALGKVMCNYALYYVTDWQQALREMRRVLKAGGRILLTGPAPDNNQQFYAFHRRLFGRLSEIDELALEFLQNRVEPFLDGEGMDFHAQTFSNEVSFPDKQQFLDYYTSTSLFRMTCGAQSRAKVEASLREAAAAWFQKDERFVNVKRIRFVGIG